MTTPYNPPSSLRASSSSGGGDGESIGGGIGAVPAPQSPALSHISAAAGTATAGSLDRSTFSLGSGASVASSSSSTTAASSSSSYMMHPPPPPPPSSRAPSYASTSSSLTTPRLGGLPPHLSMPAGGASSAFASRAGTPLRPPAGAASASVGATPFHHHHHHHGLGSEVDKQGAGSQHSLLQLLYGNWVVLRGPHGVTLTARAPDGQPASGAGGAAAAAAGAVPATPGGALSAPPMTLATGVVGMATPGAGGGGSTSFPPQSGFRAGTEGRGLGEPRESLALMNCHRRDDKGPVTYGAAVALRCGWARERFLGVHSGSNEVGFWRTLMGTAEKWTLARPDIIRAARSAHGGVAASAAAAGGLAASAAAAAAAAASKGPVLAGDRVVLQSQATKEVLCVRETPDGLEIGLVPPEAALLSHATWEIGWAGSPSYPAWNLSRPYLTGDFLAQPHRHAQPLPASSKFNTTTTTSNTPPPLGQFSLPAQERLLVGDLLWAVTGYEGRYIKLAASSPTSTASESTGNPTEGAGAAGADGLLESVEFVLGDDGGVDPSLAAMARKFLPLAGHCVKVRRFIEVKRRYDYGMVAQALAAGLASVLREYLVQVAQLEHRHQQELLGGGGSGNGGKGQGLSLQRLWFFLQPSLRTLAVLDALCTKVWRSKGGAMLNLIRAAASGGDERSAKMHAYLLERASVPYMTMLEGWIYRGQLDDPYHEFMVREEQGLAKENVEEDFNAAYWDKRSTLRPEHVFSLLDAHASQVLTTGKYLHVIRECGHAIPSPSTTALTTTSTGAAPAAATAFPKLRYAAGKAALGEAIEGAYRRACGLLLDLVLRQHQLLPRLASIKHYFLLDTGDFFVHFMNSAEHELLKTVSEISPARIESLLHLAIQMSVAGADPYKDGVSSTFVKHKLIEHLNAIHQTDHALRPPSSSSTTQPRTPQSQGAASAFAPPPTTGDSAEGADAAELPALPDVASLSLGGMAASGDGGSGVSGGPIKAYEALMLDYQAKWPLSLVVSRRAVTKYQLLFRHLFLAKFVERRLHTAWAEQQSTKELDVRGALGVAFCLRHRMQHFLENYVHYMLFEVIEPHWHALHEALRHPGEKGVEHLDDVIRLHQEFQDTCLKECLLTNQPLLKILHKVLVVCLHFAGYMEEASREFEEAAAAGASPSTHGGAEGMFAPLDKTQPPPPPPPPRGGGSSSGGGRRSASPAGNGGGQDAGTLRRERLGAATAGVRARAAASGFPRAMTAFSAQLDHHLREFLARLREDSKAQYHSHLSNLLTRLDFNGFMFGGSN